jgi:NhaP-type Na+/H+ or K+/H+ antiporter
VELILVVVGAIVVTAMAHRRGLEPALVIVVIGGVVSFFPDFEPPKLDSHILLTLVLPPLLYSAALDFSFPTFLATSARSSAWVRVWSWSPRSPWRRSRRGWSWCR